MAINAIDACKNLAIAAGMGAISMESICRALHVYESSSPPYGPYTSKLFSKKVKVDLGDYNVNGESYQSIEDRRYSDTHDRCKLGRVK